MPKKLIKKIKVHDVYFSTFRRNSGETAVFPLPVICAVLYRSKLQEKAVRPLGPHQITLRRNSSSPFLPALPRDQGSIWSHLLLRLLSEVDWSSSPCLPALHRCSVFKELFVFHPAA